MIEEFISSIADFFSTIFTLALAFIVGILGAYLRDILIFGGIFLFSLYVVGPLAWLKRKLFGE